MAGDLVLTDECCTGNIVPAYDRCTDSIVLLCEAILAKLYWHAITVLQVLYCRAIVVLTFDYHTTRHAAHISLRGYHPTSPYSLRNQMQNLTVPVLFVRGILLPAFDLPLISQRAAQIMTAVPVQERTRACSSTSRDELLRSCFAMPGTGSTEYDIR
eukprot:3839235-Rhodomonas_salina.1